MRNIDEAWQVIFDTYNIIRHPFGIHPFEITAQQIKEATRHFSKTNQREVRILCKQDTRESRPLIFQENDLFILPVKNGKYAIVQGEGYIDIPPITTTSQLYTSKLKFPLVTPTIGNSEMQHLDFAYASSIIRTFMNDSSLVLTIRGRKYTPEFQFSVERQPLTVKSVQTEVDAGYEGEHQIVLVEAKNSSTTNTIIRQLYYPFRQWETHLKAQNSKKSVYTVFFEKNASNYHLWQFKFTDPYNYNSITLVKSHTYQIV